MPHSTPAWKRFFFEGNQAWGLIDSARDWKRIVAAYEDRLRDEPDFLRNARVDPETLLQTSRRAIAFGFDLEHIGPLTLGEWADTNGMSLNPT